MHKARLLGLHDALGCRPRSDFGCFLVCLCLPYCELLTCKGSSLYFHGQLAPAMGREARRDCGWMKDIAAFLSCGLALFQSALLGHEAPTTALLAASEE